MHRNKMILLLYLFLFLSPFPKLECKAMKIRAVCLLYSHNLSNKGIAGTRCQANEHSLKARWINLLIINFEIFVSMHMYIQVFV